LGGRLTCKSAGPIAGCDKYSKYRLEKEIIMKKNLMLSVLVIVYALVLATGVQAQDQNPVGLTPTAEDAAGMGKRPTYSPYAQRGFPTQVYWGDTHVHTDNSLDARGLGVTLGPEEAFRFARGEPVEKER
jgi:hypothetical protein